MKVWIVGQLGMPWEFQGVFSTKEKAEAACKTPFHFIGPAEMDVELPEQKSFWPDAEYPRVKSLWEVKE